MSILLFINLKDGVAKATNAAAIAEAAEPNRAPRSFSVKYTPPFAALDRELCEEIAQRSHWRRAEANGAATRVTA